VSSQSLWVETLVQTELLQAFRASVYCKPAAAFIA
jgi:hypothetical protein